MTVAFASQCQSGYTVKRGDTLSAIAGAFQIPFADILAANPHLGSNARVFPGDVVRLPAAGMTTIKPAAEIRRPPGTGMAGVRGLAPQTFLGAKGVDTPLQIEVETKDIPALPTDLPAGFVALTAEQLRAIMPSAREQDIAVHLVPINRAMAHNGIDTPLRKAAFLSQIAVESGQLRYREEPATGDAYEGRAGLGNFFPGDGPRFKGRGLIQLTGRANYQRIGSGMGLALEASPDLAALPEHSANIAAFFFRSRGLNALADRRDLREITRRVNGGTGAFETRQRFFQAALAVLG